MATSVFEIIGPTMIGPSSSHTAGACRIGWAARQILDEEVVSATIHLHGSFLATGEGHGTPQALVAGLLGMHPDDGRLPSAREIAVDRGVAVRFEEIDLGPQAHPNSVQIAIGGAKSSLTLTASSVGGGSIEIGEIDGIRVHVCGTLETLLLWHRDTPGFLARVTAVLACAEINVAAIRTSRVERGLDALTAVEIDGTFPPEVPALLRLAPSVHRISLLPVLPGF